MENIKNDKQSLPTYNELLCASVSHNRISIYETENKIDKKFMEDLGQDPITEWRKIKNSLKHPMTIIPIMGAVTSLLSAYYLVGSDTFFKSVLQLLSAALIGISVNHFTSLYGKQEEKRILKFKAETTVRKLNNAIKSLLRKEMLDDKDKNIIDTLTDAINYWKDYYPNADPSQIDTLRRIRDEIKNETNNELRHKNEMKLIELETKISSFGVDSYLTLSGGTMDSRYEK